MDNILFILWLMLLMSVALSALYLLLKPLGRLYDRFIEFMTQSYEITYKDLKTGLNGYTIIHATSKARAAQLFMQRYPSYKRITKIY